MIDDLQSSILSSNRGSSYQNLMIDNAPQQKTYHNIAKLVMVTSLLSFSTFYFGFVLTNLATFSTQTILAVYGPTAAKSSIWGIVMGLSLVGAMFGAGLAPLLMKFATRKQFLIVINFLALFLLGLAQIFNFYVLIIVRILEGLLVGCYLSMVPIYINEICPKQIVGVLGVFTQLFIVLGTLVNYIIGLILTKAEIGPSSFCRIMQTYMAIPIVIQIIFLFVNFIPESPSSLIRKNKNEEAKQVISIFTLSQFVQSAYKQKCMEVEAEDRKDDDESSGTEERIEYAKRAYLLGFELPFMMQITGACGVITQMNNIIHEVIPSLSEYTGVTICSVQFIANLFTFPILAKFGRRPLSLFGNFTLGIIDILLGIVFIFEDWSASGYISFVLLLLYIIVFGCSTGVVTWIYVPQIIPAKIVPLATATNWFAASIAIMFTPFIMEANHNNAYPAFFGFGIITLILFVVNYKFMIETKGRTTRQIAQLFAKEQ